MTAILPKVYEAPNISRVGDTKSHVYGDTSSSEGVVSPRSLKFDAMYA